MKVPVKYACLCSVNTRATKVPWINPLLISFNLFSFPSWHTFHLVHMNVGSDSHAELLGWLTYTTEEWIRSQT
jgi:hypothetical protein